MDFFQVCHEIIIKTVKNIVLFKALDEEYLKVDAQFGGVDQRKIFTFAEKVRFLLSVKRSSVHWW